VSDVHEQPRIFQVGDRFHGNHLIESFLGAGASGQVYATRHLYTGDRFALKVSHLEDRRSAKKIARSLSQAKATYALRHPNVVQVLDLACEDDGMVWQLMELLEGHSVGALLDVNGRFSPLYALDIAIEAAWGLQGAHEQQIIHRDMHPFNLFVTTRGEVKVLDFSLAKVIPSGLQTTRGSQPMGTRGYMAPEYLKGGLVTPQLDVYALGTLLWQMLVGRHPFVGPGVDLLSLVRRQLEEDPPSLVTAAGLPAYCDDVIAGAVARDPARRFEGMWAFGQALQALRARLLADPEAEVLRELQAWERRRPVVSDPLRWARYQAPEAVRRAVTAPPMPSRRVVVAGAVGPVAEERRVVAKTLPMGAVVEVAAAVSGGGTERRSAPTLLMSALPVVAGVTRGGIEGGAPTVRGRARPGRRWVWAVVVAAMMMAVAVTVWALVGMRRDVRTAEGSASRGSSAASPRGGK
jgi:serine/threonine-protein kinase